MRELMIVTPAISNLIREAKTHMIYNAIETGAKHGMISMDKSLAAAVRRGEISFDEALNKARSEESFRQLCTSAGCKEG